MTENKKLDPWELLREVQEWLPRREKEEAQLHARIEAALAELESATPTGATPVLNRVTPSQEEWVIRMCKAMLMWSQKAHGDYTIGIGTDQQESFTPRQLANRVLKECGIPAGFPEEPTKPSRRKKS